MRARRTLATALLAASAALVLPAAAEPTPNRVAFYPMIVVQIRGVSGQQPTMLIDAQFPAWSCFSYWDPRGMVFDVTCVPTAAIQGTQNICAWTASISVPDPLTTTDSQRIDLERPVPPTPYASASCGDVTATSGGGTFASVQVSNRSLSALRCQVYSGSIPPGTPFQSNCNVNH